MKKLFVSRHVYVESSGEIKIVCGKREVAVNTTKSCGFFGLSQKVVEEKNLVNCYLSFAEAVDYWKAKLAAPVVLTSFSLKPGFLEGTVALYWAELEDK